MKKSRPLLAAAVLLAAACTVDTARKVKLDLPGIPEIRLESAPEIVLANVWLEKEVKDFDLPKEFSTFMKDELRAWFKGRISEKTLAWTSGDQVRSADFWKNAAAGPPAAVVLAGKALFSQEIRKALVAGDTKKFDTPFEPEKAWAERKNYSLKLELTLIKADTGEVVWQKDYQENQNYENMKQTPAYAFFDLLRRIKPRLLRALFGSDRAQERYLLSK